MHGGADAQTFFDRAFGGCIVSKQFGRVEPAVENDLHCVSDLVNGSLMPGIEEHDDGRYQLIIGHELAVTIRRDHGGDQITFWILPMLRNQLPHIIRKLLGSDVGSQFVFRRAAKHIHPNIVV